VVRHAAEGRQGPVRAVRHQLWVHSPGSRQQPKPVLADVTLDPHLLEEGLQCLELLLQGLGLEPRAEEDDAIGVDLVDGAKVLDLHEQNRADSLGQLCGCTVHEVAAELGKKRVHGADDCHRAAEGRGLHIDADGDDGLIGEGGLLQVPGGFAEAGPGEPPVLVLVSAPERVQGLGRAPGRKSYHLPGLLPAGRRHYQQLVRARLLLRADAPGVRELASLLDEGCGGPPVPVGGAALAKEDLDLLVESDITGVNPEEGQLPKSLEYKLQTLQLPE
jgi:hypothetical protein